LHNNIFKYIYCDKEAHHSVFVITLPHIDRFSKFSQWRTF